MNGSPQLAEQIASLVDQNAWNQLAALCEDYELDVANTKHLPAYAIQLFTYLIQDDLITARNLWRRIPEKVRSLHPEIGHIWAIGKALFVGDSAAVYAAASVEWHRLIAPIAAIHRQNALQLLEKSYNSLKPSALAVQLGLNEDEAVAFAMSVGWTMKDGFLAPSSSVTREAESVNTSNLSTLASYVVHLEQ